MYTNEQVKNLIESGDITFTAALGGGVSVQMTFSPLPIFVLDPDVPADPDAIVRKVTDRLNSRIRREVEEGKSEYQKLWIRLGTTLYVTPEEADALVERQDNEVLKEVIQSGRAVPDGESYIPGPTVEDFNATYETAYTPGDVEFDLSPDDFR